MAVQKHEICRLTKLINTLDGFYSDIELQISDSEQIINIIIELINKFTRVQLMSVVRKNLCEIKYIF